MIHIKNKTTILLLISSIIILSCHKENKQIAQTVRNTKPEVLQEEINILNLNKSFIGTAHNKDVTLNLNIVEKDSIYASFYNYKDPNPYDSLLTFKGTTINNLITLRSNDTIRIKGNIDQNHFKGTFIMGNKTISLDLKPNKKYSNGTIFITDGTVKKKIVLTGISDKDISQGALTEIAKFTKNDVIYHLLYLVFPSTGLYKVRGNCGGGQESLLAVLQTKDTIDDTEVQIIHLASCYNGVESLIDDNSLNEKDLINQWNSQQSLKIKKYDLRKDSYQTITINPEAKNLVHIH